MRQWLAWFFAGFRSRRFNLRAALADAITHCDRCGGIGYRLMPGGSRLTCGQCGYWRRALKDNS